MCCSESQTKFWSFLLLGSIGALVAAVFVISASIGAFNTENASAKSDLTYDCMETNSCKSNKQDQMKETNDGMYALATLVASLGCAFCCYTGKQNCIGLLLGIATAILCIIQAIVFAIYLPFMSIVSAACVALAGSCENKCTNEACEEGHGRGSVGPVTAGKYSLTPLNSTWAKENRQWNFENYTKVDGTCSTGTGQRCWVNGALQPCCLPERVICLDAKSSASMENACNKLHLITTMLYVCFIALIVATTASISCAHICRLQKKSGGDDENKDG